jgi:glyoxylase-like metal-dependent hydrolase (beta-lactamase superfamily II)
MAADVSEIAEDRELAGLPVKFGRAALKDETIGIYFDPRSHLIAAYETTDTEPILGDVPARYLLDDYRSVDGIKLPHRISISKAGAHYADVRYASTSLNDAHALAVFDIPTAIADAAAEVAAGNSDYSPLTLTAIADGVFFAQGYSHHSLVVEFPSYLAVIEAPYTQAQSRTLVKLLSSQFPGKPLRYLAVTHPHFDHIGGVRSIAATGATILVTREHEAAVRALLTARHTNPADDLDRNRMSGGKTGSVQVYSNKTVIAEGRQSIELHVVIGSPHADPIVIAYVPSAQLLFQSDLFSPGTGAGATPAASQLLRAVRVLGLDVRTNAGGHGGVGPFDELVQAVGP